MIVMCEHENSKIFVFRVSPPGFACQDLFAVHDMNDLNIDCWPAREDWVAQKLCEAEWQASPMPVFESLYVRRTLKDEEDDKHSRLGNSNTTSAGSCRFVRMITCVDAASGGQWTGRDLDPPSPLRSRLQSLWPFNGLRWERAVWDWL